MKTYVYEVTKTRADKGGVLVEAVTIDSVPAFSRRDAVTELKRKWGKCTLTFLEVEA